MGSQTMGILQSFDKDSDGSGIICKVASLSLCLKPVDICCKDSFSHCSIPMKHEEYIWMLALQNLSHSKSFILSPDLSELVASMTNVWVNPLEFALASLA